jgi:hypothetical protein
MRTQFGLSLVAAAAAGASFGGPSDAKALAPNLTAQLVPLSTRDGPPSNSITGTSAFEITSSSLPSRAQGATSPSSIRDTTADAPQEETETVETQSHAEPDACLQIAFLVLGALLALASVVVAVFFGHKQLRFMRRQSSIGHNNNVHDNPSSGVDIEMAPATDRSGPARPSAQPPSTNQVPTGFAHFLDQLKSICAAVSSPISRHEGQPPLPNQGPVPVHESLSALVETSQGHQEGNATLPTATQRI